VRVPAYDKLRDNARMGARVRDIVVKGVSMRKYEAVLPEVAGTVGVSKSAVSRRFFEPSAAQLAARNEGALVDAALPRTACRPICGATMWQADLRHTTRSSIRTPDRCRRSTHIAASATQMAWNAFPRSSRLAISLQLCGGMSFGTCCAVAHQWTFGR
jgi:hypothetical protein